MPLEYQEDELAEDSDDEKRIEKEERIAERKLLKKRKGAGKGKTPVMADKAQGGWSQQCLTAGQWQLGQLAVLTPGRSLGKQPMGLARPIGPCFASGELGHLHHQCRKAGLNLAPAASHRSYPSSSIHVVNMTVVSECNNVHMVSTDVQDAEFRSIEGEVSSKTSGKDWTLVSCQGLNAGAGSVTVSSKSKVSCDHLGYEDEYCPWTEVDEDHGEGKRQREDVRYWESDGQFSSESVKGRLRKNVQFWKEELKAPNNIIRVIEEGYELPLVSLPGAHRACNHQSALENNKFVCQEISKLVECGSLHNY